MIEHLRQLNTFLECSVIFLLVTNAASIVTALVAIMMVRDRSDA